MSDILQSLLAFIVALGVLITFHEFGHYWVARRCNVKILRFSIGFGRALFSRKVGQDQTEFVIAALPLGGYVKMLDEREGPVEAHELSRAFNRQTLAKRVAIVSAGPLFNFIFALFAYWLIFVVGVNGLKPVIGEIEPLSVAEQAGLRVGDEIISVNGTATVTWSGVADKLIKHTVNGDSIALEVMDVNGIKEALELDLSGISIDDMAEGKILSALGMSVIDIKFPAVIGEIRSGGAAEKGGLLKDDEIISVNNEPIDSWGDWVAVIRDNPDNPLIVEVLRSDEIRQLRLIPDRVESDDGVIGRIGAVAHRPDGLFDQYFNKESYSPFTACYKALEKTWDMSVLILQVLGKMLVGEASVKNLSGPIGIAQYAGESAGFGLIAFLGFMAIVSISLGVLNLLPVPLLDGGHLLYYLVEWIIGKPIPEAAWLFGQQIGLVMLLGLMSIAFYNDIVRLLG